LADDFEFIKHIKMMSGYVDKNYQAKATTPFLPGELRDIRAYLMAGNSLSKLMLWVIIIVATRLALRVDEVLNMRYEDFIQKYFVVHDTHVDSLLTSVMGKTDDEWVKLNAWDDFECPDFSPVRMILLWVRIAKIKSGFLFPSLSELYDSAGREEDNGAKNHYRYDYCLNDIQYLCYELLKYDPSDKKILVGTYHCFVPL